MLLFFESTIMRNTADLAMVQKTIKFPQSVMIWAAMSSAGVGPLCFIKSRVNAAIYQEILEHFMLPSAEKLYGDADLIFQQDLAPAHTAKGTKSWFNDHGVTVLDWPANSPDLNPIENLWGIVRDTRPNNADDMKTAIKAAWAFITPEQCHRLIVSMQRRIDAVIHAKGGPSIECIEMNILFRSLTFLFKISFLLIYVISVYYIFWETEFCLYLCTCVYLTNYLPNTTITSTKTNYLTDIHKHWLTNIFWFGTYNNNQISISTNEHASFDLEFTLIVKYTKKSN